MPILSPAAGHGILWIQGNPHIPTHAGGEMTASDNALVPEIQISSLLMPDLRTNTPLKPGQFRSGAPRTVSCAKPQTPTSGNFCTGQVSYLYGPVHHTPGKIV